MTATTEAKKTINDWAAYWFVALERAVEEGDLSAAAKAQQELDRLGYSVSVRFQGAVAGEGVPR